MCIRLTQYLVALSVLVIVALCAPTCHAPLFADTGSDPFDAVGDEELFGADEHDVFGDSDPWTGEDVASDDPADEDNPFNGDDVDKSRATANSTASVDERNTETLRRLRKSVDIDFMETPLDEAMEIALGVRTFKVVIDRFALEAIPIDPTVPITLQLSNVPLETALSLMLHPNGLDFTVHDGVVVVTTQEGAETSPVTRVFSVQALIHPESEAASIRRLIDVITTSVAPHSWERNGGSATITDYQGALIVSNTPMVLRQTEDLLLRLQEHIAQIGGPRKEVMARRTTERSAQAAYAFGGRGRSSLSSDQSETPAKPD